MASSGGLELDDRDRTVEGGDERGSGEGAHRRPAHLRLLDDVALQAHPNMQPGREGREPGPGVDGDPVEFEPVPVRCPFGHGAAVRGAAGHAFPALAVGSDPPPRHRVDIGEERRLGSELACEQPAVGRHEDGDETGDVPGADDRGCEAGEGIPVPADRRSGRGEEVVDSGGPGDLTRGEGTGDEEDGGVPRRLDDVHGRGEPELGQRGPRSGEGEDGNGAPGGGTPEKVPQAHSKAPSLQP